MSLADQVTVRWRGLLPYLVSWQAMRDFTQQRTEQTLDEIWFLEHPPVLTQGQSGKAEHILQSSDIPIIQTDRGGQVTYHGPGQLMVYTLINLNRKQLTIRQLVSSLEQSVIDLLAHYQISAQAKRDAPGVYVEQKKICSIGLRVKRGCAYHGIALNIKMNLTPFSYINPCGFAQLKMTQLADWVESDLNLPFVAEQLINYLMKNLRYTTANHIIDDHSE